MSPLSPFQHDCVLAVEVLEHWPRQSFDLVRRQLARKEPVFLVAEGSCLLMPTAFLRHCARMWGWPGTFDAVGGRAFPQLLCTPRAVIAVSCDGKTSEVVDAMPYFPREAIALLGAPAGPLTRMPHVHLLPRPERAECGTTSILAICLALSHALADLCERQMPVRLLSSLILRQLYEEIRIEPGVRRIFWAGGHSGVTGELALKTMAMTGLVGIEAPGSLMLHGIEAMLAPGDLVVAIDLFPLDFDALCARVRQQDGVALHQAIIPACGAWTPLVELAFGLRLLTVVAENLRHAQSRSAADEQAGGFQFTQADVRSPS